MSFKISEKDLLEHHNFVRSIAIRLLKPEDAEDVAQEAILNALIKPPNNIKKIRPWLKKVTKNLVNRRIRERYREEKKRSKYNIPNEDFSPEKFLLVEQARSSVISAIYDLSSEQRAAVFLRYYENLKPQEISEKLNIPLETIKSRLKRARENLRRKLDNDYGDRESWVLGVIPLAGFDTVEEAVQSSTFNSSVIVKTSRLSPILTPISIAGALALFVIFLAFWWNDFSSIQDPLATNPNGSSPQLRNTSESISSPSSSNPENSTNADSSVNNSSNQAIPANTNPASNPIAGLNFQNVRVVGVVLDEAEVPISDAQLLLESRQAETFTRHSNGFGKFTFKPVPTGSWNLICRADGFKHSTKRLTLNSKSEEQNVTFILKKANRSIVRIETQSMSLSRYQSQISVDQPEKDFDWFHPRHFSVLAAKDSSYEPPATLGGVVRKNKSSQYKYRAGELDIHGELTTEIETPIHLFLIYRNVILKHQVFKNGLERELTFEIDIENQILPLTSSISILLETNEQFDRKLKAQFRDKFTWIQGNVGTPFPLNGVLTMNRLPPGISILEIFPDGTPPPEGRWSMTREVFLPASKKAEDLVIKLDNIAIVSIESAAPDEISIRPTVKRVPFREGSFPITADATISTFLKEDGSYWAFLPKNEIPQIFVARDRSQPKYAAEPLRIEPWQNPKKIKFNFVPACELTVRFLKQKTEYDRVCLINSDGNPSWIEEVEISNDYNISLVPGRYKMIKLVRDPQGISKEVETKIISLSQGKLDITVP